MKELFEVQKIRKQFPILNQLINGKPLVYFDNAATSQKPIKVIECINEHYQKDNANVHRGIHELSARSTKKYEQTREKVAQFINSPSEKNIIFTKGATEGINLICQAYIKKLLKKGDAIVISELEHHANIVPWQLLEKQINIEIRWLPVNDRGEIIIEKLPELLSDGKVKLVSSSWISNSLGTINNIQEIIRISRNHNALTLIDSCQVPAHQRIDVQQLDCDFLVFSGHKMYASTGVGVLWGKMHHLENFDCWQGGGDMILEVDFNGFVPNEIPMRFEAGTPAICEVISLGVAIDWLNTIDLVAVKKHEQQLLSIATSELNKIPDIKIVGRAEHKTAIISFVLTSNALHPSDIATFLNLDGIAVRSGHHCTMPILKKMGLPATVRASFAMYNTEQEVEQFIQSMNKIQKNYT